MASLSKCNWASLEELSIKDNFVTWKGIRALCQNNLKELVTFEGSFNMLGNRALKYLSRTPWPRLRHLIIFRDCRITPDGAKYLRKSGLPVPHMFLPYHDGSPSIIPLTKLEKVGYKFMTYEQESRVGKMIDLIQGVESKRRSPSYLVGDFRLLLECDPRI